MRSKVKYKFVLVTGATGFLGRSLVRRLCGEGYKVTAIGLTSRINPFEEGVEYFQVNLTDINSAEQILNPWRWDAVINLAGYTAKKVTDFSNDYLLVSGHALSALNICLNIPKNWPGILIHASSMVVYGVPTSIPVAESFPIAPIDIYGTAKALSEGIIMAVGKMERIDYWILRLPGLFSETRKNGALYHFVQAAVRGDPLVISASHPMPWDILHVDDAVEAVMRTLRVNCPCPGPINISYGEPVEIETIARIIISIIGSNSEVSNPKGISHPIFQMDISRARQFLDWPPYTLHQRLEKLCHDLIGSRR